MGRNFESWLVVVTLSDASNCDCLSGFNSGGSVSREALSWIGWICNRLGDWKALDELRVSNKPKIKMRAWYLVGFSFSILQCCQSSMVRLCNNQDVSLFCFRCNNMGCWCQCGVSAMVRHSNIMERKKGFVREMTADSRLETSTRNPKPGFKFVPVAMSYRRIRF